MLLTGSETDIKAGETKLKLQGVVMEFRAYRRSFLWLGFHLAATKKQVVEKWEFTGKETFRGARGWGNYGWTPILGLAVSVRLLQTRLQ